MKIPLIIILLLLSTLLVFADTVLLDGEIIIYDLKYSLINFTNENLAKEDLNGQVIYASNFQQALPETKVFPDTLEEVTFVKCKLENVFIDDKWKNVNFIQCSIRKFKIQLDNHYWYMDRNNDNLAEEKIE